MNAFTKAAAAIFGDANLALDGVYTPSGGGAVELLVAEGQGAILEVARETEQVFATGTRRPATIGVISRAAVPARPADGDSLVVGARSFTIRAAEPDSEATRWRLDLDEIGV